MFLSIIFLRQMKNCFLDPISSMNVNTSVLLRALRFVSISKKKQKLREAVATIEADPKE